MHPHHPRTLNHPFQVRGNLIPIIQPGASFPSPSNPQQPHHLLAMYPDPLLRKPHQPCIRLIAPLRHHARIEKLRLPLKQRSGILPEPGGCEAEDREGGFVTERRGRVPGLDLLAEDQAQLGGVFLRDEGGDGRVEGLEEFARVGTGVVEVCCATLLECCVICMGGICGERGGGWVHISRV